MGAGAGRRRRAQDPEGRGRFANAAGFARTVLEAAARLEATPPKEGSLLAWFEDGTAEYAIFCMPKTADRELSAREGLIVLLTGEGLSCREIAKRLNRSPESIARDAKAICKKLGFPSRKAFVRWCFFQRLVRSGQ